MWRDGYLLRRWRGGEALYHGSLEDYAFLIRGLISLFEVGQGVEWLEWAIEMVKILQNQFKAQAGAFYQTDGTDQNIILRKCLFSDGAEPSGNAIHCENLLRLYQITYDNSYLEQAEDILKAVEIFMENYAPGYCYHMLNLVRYYDQHAVTAVVALNAEEHNKEELKKLLYHTYIPHRCIIWLEYDDAALRKIAPFTSMQIPLNGHTTLYLCQKGGVCEAPITEFSEMIAAVNAL